MTRSTSIRPDLVGFKVEVILKRVYAFAGMDEDRTDRSSPLNGRFVGVS